MFNNSNIYEQTYNRSFPGVNYGSTPLRHGSVVCMDASQTDTDAFVQVARRQSGIAAPASGNVHRILGILQVRNGKSLKQGQGGQIVWHGAAKALVYVPANIALNSGTPLALRTSWDSTNHVVDFTPDDSSSQAYGTLAPINYTGSSVIGEWAPSGTVVNDAPLPDNPIATLLEDVSSSTSARVVEAWVEVLGPHRPRPFEILFASNTASQFVDTPIKVLAGSGVVTGAWLQIGTTGTSGTSTLDIKIAPALATTDVQSVFSTPLTIDSGQADGTVVGLGAVLSGDGDTDSAPTGSTTAGTLKALASRQFPNEGLLKTAMTFASGVAAPYSLGVRGFVY